MSDELAVENILRGVPEIMRVTRRPCPLCGIVFYVSLHAGADESTWDHFWSLQSLGESGAEYVLEQTVRVAMPQLESMPVLRVIPRDGFEATEDKMNDRYLCHREVLADERTDEVGRELEVVKMVWNRVLSLNGGIADDDDFYALGGDSFLAARATGSISRELGKSVPIGVFTGDASALAIARKLRRL
jgi:hypothetical protein